MSNITDKKVVGIFEKIDFPDFNVKDMVAKMDTGAYTGALHCTKVHEQVINGKKTISFAPFDRPEVTISTSDFYRGSITSSNGQSESRYIINTIIKLHGKKYPIKLSLADRSSMKWPVLIGRRFMRKHNLIVDVSIRNK